MSEFYQFDNNLEWNFSSNFVDFEDAFSQMEARVNKIITSQAKQLIWILEHNPVYTSGISGSISDVRDDNVPIIKTNRGGKITYHGPGMKIVYVIIDLKQFFQIFQKSPEVAGFIRFIERWVILVLQDLGINSFIRQGRVGVWTDASGREEKIASIGVKIRKWVSYHGFALNVDCDLSKFKSIVPCGISEFGVTSVKNISQDKAKLCTNELIQKKFYDAIKEFNDHNLF